MSDFQNQVRLIPRPTIGADHLRQSPPTAAGFYWTSVRDGSQLEVRCWFDGLWYGAGSETLYDADEFLVLSDRLAEPRDARDEAPHQQRRYR